ncbi:MAG: WG repeat-containing protein [Alphaproteobacteria bacterium]|nr:WG repeat-containing protein [Alphaproteobacteria bacterium]
MMRSIVLALFSIMPFSSVVPENSPQVMLPSPSHHPLVIEEEYDRGTHRFPDPNPDLVVFKGNQYTPMKGNGPKQGFKTWSGKIVLPAVYDAAADFNRWGIAEVQIRKKDVQDYIKAKRVTPLSRIPSRME